MALSRPRTPVAVAAVLVAALAVAAAVAVPAVLTSRSRQERQQLEDATRAFAAAWRGGTLDRLAYTADGGAVGGAVGGAAGTALPGAQVAREVTALTRRVTPAARDVPTAVDVASVGEAREGAATAQLAVRWDLGGGDTWSYTSSLPLRQVAGAWRPAWSPAVVHPSLRPGLVLSTDRTAAPRGRILGAGGAVLVEDRPVVFVGIDPGRTKDRAATVRTVAGILDVDAADLTRRVAAARPGTFVDVITLRRADYDPVRSRLQPVPGAVFREGTLPLGPTPTFARALLGSVGPATAEVVQASEGRVRAGSLTGLSGVQRALDERLAGRAGLSVRAVAAPRTNGAAGGERPTPPAQPLLERAPVPGEDVRLGLDQRVQAAAEAALLKATKPAAVVALRPRTGEVVAVANGGPGAAGYNRALLGQYPPGSTFKVVSTLALLGRGVTPATPIACPARLTVGGRAFDNAEGEVLGVVPFRRDFALSCNTAFVGSASRVTNDQLQAAAGALGFDAATAVGVPAFTGSVPDTDDPVVHAADMIGQGTVLGSPLSVATTSASVAAGRRVTPRLVLDPAPAGADERRDEPLPGRTATDLRALMRAVVTEGTGTALKAVPGGPVHGKTGTAQYGDEQPPAEHAWFTGFQGDLAFAVVVEGGGFGGRVAAPLAADFLTRVQRG